MPKITFSTIYDFLVDRKILLKRVSYLESIADKRAEKIHNQGEQSPKDSMPQQSNGDGVYVPVEYTRTLEKAYRFYRDGHVQDIKYHPMPDIPDYVCIAAKVLPSMRKDRVYHVIIAIHESTARAITACCSCPAGLSGCCNHITATLYCLEDYVHSGLQDDEQIGCTDRLQTWNQPRKRNVDARPTDEVTLTKEEYGLKKRLKVHQINKWDCRPLSRRIVDPNKARKLQERLSVIEESKIAATDHVILGARTPGEKKKASEAKSLLTKYGSSCFLQILDNEPAPSQNHLEEIKEERLVRAATKRKKFQEELSAQLLHIQHDHGYRCSINAPDHDDTAELKALEHSHLAKELYESHVILCQDQIAKLEANTRMQSASELWSNARKLRITASTMKEVCHRKSTTSCGPFIQKKLASLSIKTAAIAYGRKHEKDAISSYIGYHESKGTNVEVTKCGLIVDASEPWLAASPDGIVLDPTMSEHNRGCLEVKCPFVCEKMTILEASRQVAAFCLVENSGKMYLSESHGYYYQIQTQMHVTNLKWCDFVIWHPQEVFVQRIWYDTTFMKAAISKAKTYYFEKFLPAVVPYMIIKPSSEKSVIENDQSVASTQVYAKSTAVSVGNHKMLSSFEKCNPSFPVVPTAKSPSSFCSSIPTRTVDQPFDTGVSMGKPYITSKQNIPLSSDKYTLSSIVSCSTVFTTTSTSNGPSTSSSTVNDPSLTNFSVSASAPTKMTSSKKRIISCPAVSNTSLSDIPSSDSSKTLSKFDNAPDEVQITGATKTMSLPLQTVLQHLHVKKHSVKGDGSCLYHSVAHQAGLISADSQGDQKMSQHLRQLVLSMMWKYPDVREEGGLSNIQWLQKRQEVLDVDVWGGDVELRLLAIGLHRDIVVLTTSSNQNYTFARKFPCDPPPVPKMRGGIFVPLTTNEVCNQWNSFNQSPLLTIFNGQNHYDSTICL